MRIYQTSHDRCAWPLSAAAPHPTRGAQGHPTLRCLQAHPDPLGLLVGVFRAMAARCAALSVNASTSRVRRVLSASRLGGVLDLWYERYHLACVA